MINQINWALIGFVLDPINRPSAIRALNVILSGLLMNRINRLINPIFRTLHRN